MPATMDMGGFPGVGQIARFNPVTGTLGPIPGLSVIGGSVLGVDGSATATSTDGFFYMASGAGPPTGTPTSYSGRTPLWIDTTNNTLYYYSGGAWVALINTTGAGGGVVRIAQTITSGSATTVSFSSIPATYSQLQVTYSGQDTKNTVGDVQFRLEINGDTTAANYSVEQFHDATGGAGGAGTVASTTSGVGIGSIPGVSANANAVGAGEILIPNYARTTFQKVIFARNMVISAAGPVTTIYSGMGFVWKNTAAINALLFTSGGTAFVDGTTFTLYGIA